MADIFKTNSSRGDTRIVLKAYAYNHQGEIISKGSRLRVSLIDITPGGARLKMTTPAESPPAVGETFACNIRLADLGVESGEIPCRTVWRDGDEFGVAFVKTLDTTVTELQKKLDIRNKGA